MAYKVELSRRAKKELDGLPERIQQKCYEALTYLQLNPFSDVLNVKKLRGPESLYRVRLGDYRIVYHVDKGVLLVLVVKIGHRSDIYR